MPGFDGTGPRGQGPMTGGGFGRCRGDRGGGRGMGRGAVFSGRGCRHMYYATGRPGWARTATMADPDAAPDAGEAQALRGEVEALKARLAALEAGGEGGPESPADKRLAE